MHGASLGGYFLVFSVLDQTLLNWALIEITGGFSKPLHIENVDEFAFDLDHFGTFKASQESADGFER